MIRDVFETRDDFWLDDLRRLSSAESDYGVHWRHMGADWPRWRVSYVRDTGDVYAICQQSPFEVLLLGTVPADPVDETVPFEKRESWYRTLDQILDGWAEPDISGHDLAWVQARLDRVPVARCRHCGAVITELGAIWTDGAGFPACIKSGPLWVRTDAPGWRVEFDYPRVLHEPMPAGLAGAETLREG
jgi:hypothetical protein